MWSVMHFVLASTFTVPREPKRRQDLCVGDFWETQERRNMSTFTTVIGVDKFLLITPAVAQDSLPMLMWPVSFDPSR